LRTDLLVERALRSTLPDDLAAAEQATRARVASDPSGPRAHRQLGLVLDAAGRPADARAALSRALALDPGDAVAEQVLAALDDGPGAGADGSGEAEER
jgi:Flp pilus assembly protein TadD